MLTTHQLILCEITHNTLRACITNNQCKSIDWMYEIYLMSVCICKKGYRAECGFQVNIELCVRVCVLPNVLKTNILFMFVFETFNYNLYRLHGLWGTSALGSIRFDSIPLNCTACVQDANRRMMEWHNVHKHILNESC